MDNPKNIDKIGTHHRRSREENMKMTHNEDRQTMPVINTQECQREKREKILVSKFITYHHHHKVTMSARSHAIFGNSSEESP